MNESLKDIFKGASAALQEHARRAGADGQAILEHAAESLAAIARDAADGKLTLSQSLDFARKAETAATARLAAVLNVQARSYVKSVIGTILGGLTGILGSFNWPKP